jgi:hypothetical protein
MRPFTLACFLAFAIAGAWLYQVKNQVAAYDRHLQALFADIAQTRHRTAVLDAELTLVTRGDWVRGLAQRHLTLEPAQPQQTVRPSMLARRLPPAVAFAGAPSLFAPPPSAAPSAAPAAAPAAAPTMLATAPAASATAATRGAETPAPQALAATLAAQRASRPPPPAPVMPARPAPLRDAAPAARPTAVVRTAPTPAPQPLGRTAIASAAPPARPAPNVVSALGMSSLGGGLGLAPPVPINPAAAGTLPPGMRPPPR